MNLDDAVVLETFHSRIEAEMAAGLLVSEGVEAMVLADDAGRLPLASVRPGSTPHGGRRGRLPGPDDPEGYGGSGGAGGGIAKSHFKTYFRRQLELQNRV